MQKELEQKKASEETKKLKELEDQKKEYFEAQKKKIEEYNKKKREAEVMLGMHMNHSATAKLDRLYSPQTLKVIKDV